VATSFKLASVAAPRGSRWFSRGIRILSSAVLRSITFMSKQSSRAGVVVLPGVFTGC
jgi:hypothetical protein